MARRRRRPRRPNPGRAAKAAPRESPQAPPGHDAPPSHAPAQPPEGARRQAFAQAWPALVLIALGAVSYLPAMLWGGFVWDDVIFTEAKGVREWSGLWGIWFRPTEAIAAEGHYWPLLYTTFWLEHKLWGFSPTGYHIVNVALHLANTLLLWRILGRLAVPGPLLVAALFAVHPLHVESVAWIMERKDVLSGFFYLTAVLVWMRFTEAPRPGRYVLALALYVAGLLAKSVVVTLPAALLVLQWWRRGRLSVRDLVRLAPFLAVGLAIAAGDFAFYASREPLDLGYSFVERVLIAARALWFYVGKLLWPVDLAIIYPLWDIRATDPVAWLYVAAAVAVVAALWALRHRIGRGPLAGALFFGVTLSPVLGFVDYGYMQYSFVADRFQYLAGIGVMAVLVGMLVSGLAMARAANRLPKLAGALGPVAAAVVLVVLGTATWRHATVFGDDLTLGHHIVALNPDARDAHLGLGAALARAGRMEEAAVATRIAVERDPGSAKANANWGLILLEQGRLEDALEATRRAVELDPNTPGGYVNLAKVLIAMDRVADAEDSLRRANRSNPGDLDILQNLGESLRMQKRYEEAIEVYAGIVAVDPARPLTHAAMGDALFRLQRHDAALAAIERAVTLAPDASFVASMHVLAGQAELAAGRPGAALESFDRALAGDAAPAGAEAGRERALQALSATAAPEPATPPATPPADPSPGR